MSSSFASPTHSLNSNLPPKPKKFEQTSMVWKYFTKVEGSDLEDSKLQYKYCNKLFSCHTKKQGTSIILVHLRNTCKKYPDRFEKDNKSQSKLSFEIKRK
jgi:hypothetical protein